MTFTYTGDLTLARDYIRFHTTDTVSGESFLTDEVIASLVATSASHNAAVISGIEYIIGLFSRPNFKADWLQIDNKSAREGFEAMLLLKKKKFGLLYQAATHTPVYREDETIDTADSLITFSEDELP